MHIKVIVPKNLSKKQKDAIKSMGNLLEDSNHAEKSDFKKKFKDLFK